MDVAALKASWAQVVELGDQAAAYFYATLFSLDPELRKLFSASMGGQRDRLLSALGHIVSNVDDTEALVPFVQQLGRDHRRFEVTAEHFPTVGRALLHTLAHGLGPAWNEQLASDWAEAYGLVSKVMIEAAEAAKQVEPPWWNAEIVSHERRSPDVAVLTVRPDHELRYRSGQSIAVESHLRPRVWRYLSPANARRPDGTIEFHVRAVAGGQFSPAMVYQARQGDLLRLGAPIGTRMTVSQDSRQDLLLLAGGTGLAPMKAIIEELASNLDSRRVTLVVGAATQWDLYDMQALIQLANELRWLHLIPAMSDDPIQPRATVVEAALRAGSWHDRQIYICGSPAMVSGTRQTLMEHGYQPDAVRVEQFDDKTYAPLSASLPPQRMPQEATRR
ncbi:globin domain-containing protein [Rugosimonospora africana]|uniref:nitric oxide dioxygenase n=1 Tax=Rugosimonospora africana TaxID=556532 RepID=A0A8J3QQB7_9ACTN|nr:globin domain-containing protein [Rugosimonospora africana]GIH14342.1 oxidoreductase [Rugosimonospora africana]